MTAEITTPTLTLRQLDMDRDLEGLAQMWRESDDQWPGTISDGVPLDVDWVRAFLQREKFREVAIWQADDAIAGYCSLWDYVEEPGVVYIATLNVAPRFQKLSLGRRFLTYFVGRAAELGAPRLDLHTWPGNLKAVPLYKKCGFFWDPGPAVHMINLLPTILRMPAARSFFDMHDWYATFQRELTQKEDDERWEGMQVFTYRFAAANDELTVWGHRHSRGVTALENRDLFAAAIVADETPARGLKTPIRWKVTNKRAEAVDVTLIASGTKDLQLDQRATLRLNPGETTEINGQIGVASTIEDIPPGRVAPSVRSILIIGGVSVELNTGLRPHAPVEVATYPAHITLTPGVAQSVTLQLRSRLPADITATVTAAAAPGLEAEWAQQALSLTAEGFAGIPLTLRAAAPGVYDLPVTLRFEYHGETITLPPATLAVFALPLGGVLGAKVGDRLRLENEFVRMIIEPRGAETRLYDPASNMSLGALSGYSVPPGAPSEYWDAMYDLAIEHRNGEIVAVATTPSKEHPGFVLRRRITIGAGPLLAMAHEFDNRGPTPLRFRLHQRLDINNWRVDCILPLDSGLARGPAESFPGVMTEDLKRPARFAESWVAYEGPRATIGMLFPSDTDRIDWGWDGLLSTHYECPAGGRAFPAPMIVYVGTGGWQAVRRLWQRHSSGVSEAAHLMPSPANAIEVRAEPPAALALAGETAAITLRVDHAQARPTAGRLHLELPTDWHSDAETTAFSDVNRGAPFRLVANITAPTTPLAAEALVTLHSPDLDADIRLPLVCIGRRGPVAVRETEMHQQRVLTVENGRLSFAVTPGFAASVASLRVNGVEWLRSPFPTTATFAWMAPWFGGLTPFVHLEGANRFPGVLWRESFDAAAVQVEYRGFNWYGVRQCAIGRGEDLQGLELEIDTLTLNDSPVVRLAIRLLNRTPVWRKIDEFGWLSFVQPGGDPGERTLWSEGLQIKQNDRGDWHGVGTWVAAESVASGQTLLLCSPRNAAMAIGWGVEGGHPALNHHGIVPPNGVLELDAYLVVTDDINDARRWVALAR